MSTRSNPETKAARTPKKRGLLKRLNSWAEENLGYYMHWQNLSAPRGVANNAVFPRKGRAWLSALHRHAGLGFEWVLWDWHRFGFSFRWDDSEGRWCVSVAHPLAAFYFHINGLPGLKCKEGEYTASRRIGFDLYLGLSPDDFPAFSYELWVPDDDINGRRPKWRVRYFDLTDLLLGSNDCRFETLKSLKTTIQLPEGTYPIRVTLKRRIDKRPRWFTKVSSSSEVEALEVPPPVPGKGTMSYNCDDSYISSQCTNASSVAEAVSNYTAAILRDRERYGGSHEWQPATH